MKFSPPVRKDIIVSHGMDDSQAKHRIMKGEIMPDKNKIKAVIFDWAGTTIDFGCMAPPAVFVDAFQEKGIEITVQEAREPMGLKKIDHVKALFEQPRIQKAWIKKWGDPPEEKDVEAIYKILEPLLINVVKNYCELIPGVEELLKTLRGQGIQIGSTTGYTTPIMDVVAPLAAAGGYQPDCYVTSSEVPRGRPAPWMCFENARRLGVYPMQQMIKVGDTVADIKEGLMAGMWTVGIIKSGNELGYSLEEIEQVDPEMRQQKCQAAARKLSQAGAHYVIDGVWDLMPIIGQINNRIKRAEQPALLYES